MSLFLAGFMQHKNLEAKRSILKRAVASLLLASTFTTGGAFCAAVQGVAAAAASKKHAGQDNDGLDAQVRPLVNTGQWADALQKLQQLSENDETCGRNEAWLAFAYLYTGKLKDIKALAKRVDAMPENDKDPNARGLVDAFASTMQGKFDDAAKQLNGLKQDENADPLAQFARACVALKKGNAAKAAEFCEKVVGLCPNFAWGYRTLGFIQDKSLKNAELAERAYRKALAAEPDFKDVRGLLVDLLLSKNDFDGAIAVAQEAIKLFPHDAGNYYRLSQIYQQQWRLNEALEQLRKAVQLAKDDPRFYRAMATIYRFQGKMTDAVARQQKAVELSKDKAFELIELAGLQEQNQNAAAAVESLKTALKESPANTIAHQKLTALLQKEGRTDDLIAEYRRAIELEPKSEPLRLNLAQALIKEGKNDEAIQQLKDAANLEQTDARPHREIAKLELQKKDYQAAAKSYTRALNISLGTHAADAAAVDDLVALGFCYASNDDYMQAETAFTTAFAMLQLGATTGLQSTVNPSDILRSLSSVFFSEGRYREAVVNLETGVLPYDKDPSQKRLDQLMCSECKALRDRNADGVKELQKSFADLDHETQLNSLVVYIDTCLKLGKKELAIDTIKKFDEAELKEKDPLVLATVWLAQDRTKEARDLVNSVLEAKKDDREMLASAYVVLAHCQLKDSDSKSAIEALQKATDTNQKDFNAIVELGRLYLADKRSTEAKQSAQKALDVNQYSVPAYLLLADAYMAMGKFKDAELSFQKAAELYPTSIEAHKGLLSAFQKQAKTHEAQREEQIIANLSKNG